MLLAECCSQQVDFSMNKKEDALAAKASAIYAHHSAARGHLARVVPLHVVVQGNVSFRFNGLKKFQERGRLVIVSRDTHLRERERES